MDFGLSEEQAIFRDSVARFLAEECPFERRGETIGQGEGFREDSWRRMAELGWLAAPFPEAAGGLGWGMLGAALVMEQFGRALVASPYHASVVLGGTVLLRSSTPAQHGDLLAEVMSGEQRLAFAHEEPGSRHDPAFVTTRAERDGESYVLTGTKANVAWVSVADHVLVSARTSGEASSREGISVFLVPATTPGLRIVPYATQDGGRAGDLVLDRAIVPAEALVGAQGQGIGLIEDALDAGAATACAEAVGAMWSIHDRTLDYLKTREQFGAALGSFQALQHRMVDMYMACQLAQSITMDAIAALDRGDRFEARQAVSAAKAHVGRSARRVGQEGIQLHGGIGMTMELPIGHYFKRLTAIGLSYGDAVWHRRRYLADQDTANRPA